MIWERDGEKGGRLYSKGGKQLKKRSSLGGRCDSLSRGELTGTGNLMGGGRKN